MRGCSVQNSPRSCRLAHPEILLSGPPSTVSSWRLTAAARRKNSSPENLTHLHYNLLGKDSSVVRRKSCTAVWPIAAVHWERVGRSKLTRRKGSGWFWQSR